MSLRIALWRVADQNLDRVEGFLERKLVHECRRPRAGSLRPGGSESNRSAAVWPGGGFEDPAQNSGRYFGFLCPG